MLYDVTINGEKRKVVGHYGRNGFYYTLDRTTGKFIKAEKYVNDLNWTKGIDPKIGKPFEYNAKIDVQTNNPEARALRGDGSKRTCPTWHGGVAHQPLAFNPVKGIAYRRRHRGLLLADWRRGGVTVEGRRHRQHGRASSEVQQATFTTARNRIRRREPQSARESG
jgi:glucose dehydrogenase